MRDAERLKIEKFLEDEALVEVIQSFLMAEIEKQKLNLNPGDNNELLGEKLKAIIVAKNLIKEGFKELSTHKKQAEQVPKMNEAR